MYALFATLGIIFAAWYLLTAVRGVLFGPFNEANADLQDMRPHEILSVLPLAIFFFVIGFFPNLLFEKINPSVELVVNKLGGEVLVSAEADHGENHAADDDEEVGHQDADDDSH